MNSLTLTNCTKQVAESLLLGTLESLRRAREAAGRADITQSSFVSALLQRFEILEVLLERSEDIKRDGRETFLRLLAALLAVSDTTSRWQV